MRESLVRPADPALRRANRIANLGDELLAARGRAEETQDAHRFSREENQVAREEVLRLEREIASLN